MKMLSWLLNDYWTFPVVCYFGQVENSETSETSETSEIFFRLFLSRLFNFGPVLKIENSKEEKSEKIFRGFRRFQRFRVFNLPLFYLTFSSNRLSFFTLHRFFCFFLTLFEFVILGYWTVIIQYANLYLKSHE